MLKLWGKRAPDMIHKPLFEGLPEVRSQGFEELLLHVYTTGERFVANERPTMLPRKGTMEMVYINFVYEAFRENDGAISGIMVVAMDVTAQVLARQKIEEAEERARLAVESAELGTYETNLKTTEIVTSPRMESIFNVEDTTDRNRYIDAVHPEDRHIRQEAYRKANETGLLEYDARIIRKDGSHLWIRVKGKMYNDENNTPDRLLGVVQDISAQKAFETALSRQVRERTIELENLNIELKRSNANLEEFAHAASHDLKEPIRKIHYFTNQLRNQLSERLQDNEKQTFKRIENATQRMGGLVDDLLLYSHVSSKPHAKEEVDLNQKIAKVLEDLELEIQGKHAIIHIGTLPVVKEYRRQLQQLFQNLIGNALKYSKPDVNPIITVTSLLINGENTRLLFSEAEPERMYHLVEVKDNGIGFEQKEAERIFQMFQRLRGNAEYRGTGVGLAIAIKVVENHNGKIIAESQVGMGATFKVYLPA